MKQACAFLFLVCATAAALSVDDRADQGDTVVVFALIDGCPDFPGILATQKVAPDSRLTVLGLDPVDTYQNTALQIRAALVEEITERRENPNPPESLRVVILRAEREAMILQDQILASYEYLATSRCLRSPKFHKPPFERQREILEATWPRIG